MSSPPRRPLVDAGLIAGLSGAVLAVGEPPLNLFVGAAGALTAIYITVNHRRGGTP